MTITSEPNVSTMRVEPVRPGFVGEVSGIDLTRELSSAEQGDLRQALDTYSVLMFRDQRIDDEDQLRLAGYLGRLRKVKGRPYIGTAGNVDDEGNIIAADDVRQWVAKGSRNFGCQSCESLRPRDVGDCDHDAGVIQVLDELLVAVLGIHHYFDG